jgi:hypothetical protein
LRLVAQPARDGIDDPCDESVRRQRERHREEALRLLADEQRQETSGHGRPRTGAEAAEDEADEASEAPSIEFARRCLVEGLDDPLGHQDDPSETTS